MPLRQRPDADRAQLAALREHVAARPSPGWLRRSLTGRRRRTVTVVLGLVAAAATLQVISGAETARRQWERAGPVPVATRTLEAGTVISEEDFQIIEMPALAVADETPAALTGRVVSARVLQGEVLVEARIAPAGLGPLAGMLEEEQRAVAIPVTGPVPALERGDRIDLHSVADPYGEIWSPGDGPATEGLLAAGVEVLEATEEAVTVAVPAESVPAVAAAISTSAVVPALTGR